MGLNGGTTRSSLVSVNLLTRSYEMHWSDSVMNDIVLNVLHIDVF